MRPLGLGGESSALVRSDVLVRLRTVNSVDRVAASRLPVRSAVGRRRGRVIDTVGASASDRSGVEVQDDESDRPVLNLNREFELRIAVP